MTHATNADQELGSRGWHKPWSGSNNGNCLEAKQLDDGNVALRQSTDPHGPALICTPAEITQFITAAKSGLADFLIR
ncbi:DUF397 domain-containing protein [Streptomyces roseirectus]|uniref:DUF397 domain-containing protein n=1 Tax=Streptomyces roseirectus TaxID=2768066 RepID=A0A7H0IQA2_9ACTN|nr:DUF397 domain-containing protein [Streptomyces roseirectus]QNP74968.1 DUF397 domain-containing protein [Streptomyces roseirectus]